MAFDSLLKWYSRVTWILGISPVVFLKNKNQFLNTKIKWFQLVIVIVILINNVIITWEWYLKEFMSLDFIQLCVHSAHPLFDLFNANQFLLRTKITCWLFLDTSLFCTSFATSWFPTNLMDKESLFGSCHELFTNSAPNFLSLQD